MLTKASSRTKRSRSLSRANARERAEEDLATADPDAITDAKRARSKSGVRSWSTSKVAPRDVGGLPPSKEVRAKAEKLRKGQQKALGRAARKGEGDRVHADMMPKWLNRGKMSNGTRDWR